MNVNGKHYRTIWLKKDKLTIVQIIDQRWLPHKFEIEDLKTVEDVVAALKDMHVRGAGLIGAAAGYGMYIASLSASDDNFDEQIKNAGNKLKATRPTAVNLAWAVERQIKSMSLKKTIKEKKWNNKVDLVFTSPPYYYTEKYAEGSNYENKQSWKRYNTYEQWKNNFLFKTFDNFNSVLEKDGILALNIFDINIRKEKYGVVNDFIDYSSGKGYEYLGFVGMRMKQRPKNFLNVSHKEEYMSANYVEPIWILKKL